MNNPFTEQPCFKVQPPTKQQGIALQALQRGEANEGQQKIALLYITNVIARPHDILFVPGDDGQTAFLNGRAFVGMQILKTLNVNVGKLQDEETSK